MKFFANYEFLQPHYLWLLLIIPAILAWKYFVHKSDKATVVYPGTAELFENTKSMRARLSFLPLLLRYLAIAAIIIAIARPVSYTSGENIDTEGIDIVLVLDISGSMLAEDFKPNRLDAAKNLTKEFVLARQTDRIGLVIFSRDAFTQCPLTVDYKVLTDQLRAVKSGMIEDGTAIGNAITNGVNRLKDSDTKSKVLILLTDGVNNAGEVDPITATEIAKTFGVRIYTIGVGTVGEAPYPYITAFGKQYQMVPVQIDDAMLTKIAAETGGKYFRATGNKKLEGIYQEIDKLERSIIEVTSYRNKTEHFYPFAIAALLLVFLEFLLGKTYFRRMA